MFAFLIVLANAHEKIKLIIEDYVLTKNIVALTDQLIRERHNDYERNQTCICPSALFAHE
jgi:hypothetical protein